MRYRTTSVAAACAAALALAACLPSDAAAQRPRGGSRAAKTAAAREKVFFDDLSYASRDDLAQRGWIVRTAAGWPGIPGASWRPEGVTFLEEGAGRQRARFLRMTASTDGNGANTAQTQICQQRKFLEGTYAARVRFTDRAASGPDGDQVVESFYVISPLKAPMDLDYSELDFEYLPHGGWGVAGSTLYGTSWETFSPEPNWKKDNTFTMTAGSRAGWHTLVTQVGDGKIRYYVDGVLLGEHGGTYYPESFMSINFNLWFIKDGAISDAAARSYTEDIDWVYHQADVVLSPAEVEARIAAFKRQRVAYRDTVPARVPALSSPCDF